MTDKDNLPEKLYGVLAELLNRKSNIAILDSIRGEYGVLNCLYSAEEGLPAGDLCRRLHVVPGRMADILKQLEKKQLITRTKDDKDRRMVISRITDAGRKLIDKRRAEIHEEYKGMFDKLGEQDTRELIRLLRIVLAYYPEDNDNVETSEKICEKN